MIVVKETLKIRSRPPELSLREERECVIREVLGSIRKRSFGCQQDFSGIGVVPLLCIALQNTLFQNHCMVCCEVTDGLFIPQITSQ